MSIRYIPGSRVIYFKLSFKVQVKCNQPPQSSSKTQEALSFNNVQLNIHMQCNMHTTGPLPKRIISLRAKQ